jgi:hypothetical protein
MFPAETVHHVEFEEKERREHDGGVNHSDEHAD